MSSSSAAASASSSSSGFFTRDLADSDPEIKRAIDQELNRQQTEIELIASENIVSRAVLEAQGSILTNKYAEGYPGRRYYGGCQFVDIAESLAIDRARKLFDCAFVNVQPNSGSQANQGAFTALIKPGDTILGMSLAAGGHLTHGAAPNQSGKWFNAVQYGVRQQDHLIDMDEVESLARQHKPKLIIAGGSAYPRVIDFKAFRQIADAVGALFMVDMAHFAGLVAGGVHPSPLPHADIVTTTTHKTLRGPRGGFVLAREDLGKSIDKQVFPGMQGGPLMHIIAAKAVAFREALAPSFRDYAQQIVANARVLAETLMERGFNLVSGGTDNHLLLLDLRNREELSGKKAEEALGNAGITVNKNTVPGETRSPFVTSGVRIGTAALTTRGMKEAEMRTIGGWIADVLSAPDDETVATRVRTAIHELCEGFPLYPELRKQHHSAG